MDEIKIFKSEKFGEMRTVTIDNEVWFVGKDLSKILGYKTLQRMYDHVEKEDKQNINPQSKQFQGLCENGSTVLESNPNVYILTLINESGMYDAIFGSKLPQAKQFKRWVTSEVLPMIRKTGGYVNDDDLFLNTYLPNADESTKLLFKAQLQVVKSLNNKVSKLEEEKDILLTTLLTIEDSRTLINAMIRKIASNKFHGNFKACWNSFYTQINYKLGINLKARGKTPYINHLSKEEMIEAEKVVRAWAVNLELDLNDILNLKVN